MIILRKLMLPALLSLISIKGLAQQDTQYMEQAQKALDASHKCDEAMRLLNLVSTDNRQAQGYLLCMGRTQDCMHNNEQALYYYNKYLALQPASDSVKKRVAELTDEKTRAVRVSGEERKAKEIYGKAAKHRKYRGLTLDENYYWTGISYGMGVGSDKSPFKSAVGFHAGNGFLIINDHALLDYTISTAFLATANKTWFTSVIAPISVGPPVITNDIHIGYAQALAMGMSAILINNRDIALTAGLTGGIGYYSFPNTLSYYESVSIDSKFSFIYGIKSNLYIGEHFLVFANLQLSAANSANVSSGLVSYPVPTSYSMFNIGIAAKIDSWW